MLANVISGWVSHLLTIITGFLVPRIMDAELGSTMLGIWDLAWSIVVYLSLGSLGLGGSLNRFISIYRADGDTEQLQVAVSTSVAIQVTMAAVIAIVAAVVARMIPMTATDLGANTVVAQYVILILGMSISVRFLFDTSRSILNGCHRWDITNSISAGTNLLSSALIIVLLLNGYGLIAASIAYTSCTILECILRLPFLRNICPEATFRFSLISKSFAVELFRFGITVFLMGLTPVVIIHATNIMIAASIGVQFLAIYARPSALVRFIRQAVTRFTYTLTPMAGPILRTEGPEELRQFLIACTKYGFACTLPAITLFCFYGGDIIRIWMGDDYVRYSIILILGIGAILPLSQSPITRILVGLGYHGKIYVRAMLIGLGIFSMGALVLINRDSTMEEFALLMVLTLSVMDGIFVPYYACRKLDLPVGRYVSQSFMKVVGLWSIPTFLLFVLKVYVSNLTVAVELGSLLVYCAALAFLYWTYLLPTETKALIRRKFL